MPDNESPDNSEKQFLHLPDETVLEIVEARDKAKRKPRKRAYLYPDSRLRTMLPLILGMAIALVIGFAAALWFTSAPAVLNPVSSDAQSLLWASSALKALDNDDADLGVRLALEANQSSQPYIQAQQALFAAAYSPGTVTLLPNNENAVNEIAVSPDGNWLAAIYFWEPNLSLWDIKNRFIVRNFDTQALKGNLDFEAITFSPDGRYLVAGGNAYQSGALWPVLALWDVATGQYIRSLTGHTSRIASVAFSPDSHFMLSGAGQINELVDYSIRLWDVETGQQIRQYDGHTGDVTSLIFNADGSRFLSASMDGRLILWDTQTGQQIQQYSEGDNLITSADMRSDGLYALTGSFDHAMRVWDLTMGLLVSRYVKQSDILSEVAFSPDGRYAASSSYDGSVSLNDLETHTEINHFLGHTDRVVSVVFSPDGRYLFSSSEDGIRKWSVGSNGRTEIWRYDSPVRSLALSPDDKTLLVGLESGLILEEDAQTGQVIRQLQSGNEAVIRIAFSPDGHLAVSGAAYPENYRILWNVETGEAIGQLKGENTKGFADSLEFSADGKQILGSGLGTAVLWDTGTGNEVKEFERQGNPGVEEALFSADGSKILAGLQQNDMILWDAKTGTILKEFVRSAPSNLQAIAFSPDEQTALGGYRDGTLILWDINSGAEIRRFAGHGGPVSRILFTPNGRYILSGSESPSNNLILWDTASGEELYRFSGYTGSVNDLALTADGSTLYSASSDGTVQVWYIPRSVDELKAWITQNHYVRDFSCAERKQYQILPECASDNP